MKKIIKKPITWVAIIVFIAVVAFLKFSDNEERFTVTCNDGTVTEISAKELIEIRENDAHRWQNYSRTEVSGTGKITKITAVNGASSNFNSVTSSRVKTDPITGKKTVDTYYYYEIEINSDTLLLVRREAFGNFYVGDEVKFDGEIASGWGSYRLYIDCCITNNYDNPETHVFLVDD